MRRAIRVAQALFLFALLASSRAGADSLVPEATSADQSKASPLIPEAPKQEPVISPHALAFRARWLTTPGWALGPYVQEHTQLNDGWGLGLEYIYWASGFDVVISLEYASINPDDGNYLGKGHAANSDTHYLHFDGLSTLSADVSLVKRWNLTPWLELRLGGGLGLGGVFGNIYLTTNSTCTAANAGDPSKCYPSNTGPLDPKDPNAVTALQAHPCSDPSLDTAAAPCYRKYDSYPMNVRVVPVINAVLGLRFQVQKHVYIHLEGGWRLAGFFVGAGPEYRF